MLDMQSIALEFHAGNLSEGQALALLAETGLSPRRAVNLLFRGGPNRDPKEENSTTEEPARFGVETPFVQYLLRSGKRYAMRGDNVRANEQRERMVALVGEDETIALCEIYRFGPSVRTRLIDSRIECGETLPRANFV